MLSTAELIALHETRREIVGLQVKTIGIDAEHPAATVTARASSLQIAPSTYFVVLAWQRDEGRFLDECLQIPSERLSDIASEDAYGHVKFEFRPDSAAYGRLDQFRRRLPELKDEIERLLV